MNLTAVIFLRTNVEGVLFFYLLLDRVCYVWRDAIYYPCFFPIGEYVTHFDILVPICLSSSVGFSLINFFFFNAENKIFILSGFHLILLHS